MNAPLITQAVVYIANERFQWKGFVCHSRKQPKTSERSTWQRSERFVSSVGAGEMEIIIGGYRYWVYACLGVIGYHHASLIRRGWWGKHGVDKDRLYISTSEEMPERKDGSFEKVAVYSLEVDEGASPIPFPMT
ncbi:hypothetical protein CC1G_14838 [Coprinopsis cinerea okayama7|uniref:Uncharacterized protein n=1 Tax=Coprinopsis cinerea (strain Okayama-7 / 130 / ATCC MYA-4618 / FGSC 9003) TaxID=240176 RepID=D6RNI8_COPC7|nr:hypothetical protein CC1G_14838 [Coprinopsis cinerea okayama7\|eukprot:XP_002910859.1 hypothetical protein CC1G_14838 [Coprinopsis cinerea okayama7\